MCWASTEGKLDPGEGYVWKDPPELDESQFAPCPAPWFAEFSQLKSAAEALNCSVPEVDKYPLEWKMRALAYQKVIEKAKPGLEALAEEKAEQKAREKEIRKRKRKK